jgi:opacity protein-like surface antigen
MFQNKFKNLVFFIALTLSAQQSKAVFLITPSIGYKMQTLKLTDNADLDQNAKMSDPAYGLKLGFLSASGVGFDIAADYAAGKSKITIANVEVESDYNHTTAAAQLSVSANVFKIYLGYVLMNEITFKGDTPGNGSKMKGTGYQAGVALALTQALSLGAQYQIDQFNQINLESVGSYEDLKTYYKKVDSQSTTISLAYSF